MKENQSKKHGKIIPVRLIKNKFVRVREIPALESKNLKSQIDTNSSFSTEPSNRIFSTRSTNKSLDKFSVELQKKYDQLVEDVKNDKEMIGTVEESKGEYPNTNPFGPSSNMHTQKNISNTKKVFFKKTDEQTVVYKVLDIKESNLFLTIYNKTPPEKKYFKLSEIGQIMKVQSKFKSLYLREVDHCVDRLKANACILETMLLLIGRAYDNAAKKKTFKSLKREFHDPFNNINDELRYEDKLQFKLPNRYYNYNISLINQINTPRKAPQIKIPNLKFIN